MRTLVWFFCLVFLCNAKREHPVPTYFRRTDADGNLLNRARPEYLKDIPETYTTDILPEDAGASLKVLPLVTQNGGHVTVTWNGISNPQGNDFIGFYCPADDNPSHHLDIFFVTESKTWNKGFGNHTVVVYNMRTTCVFKYYKNNNVSQLAAVSNELSFSDGGMIAPLQGHIALTGKATEMRVMWTSGKAASPVMVTYGLSQSMENSTKNITVGTYTKDSMCEGPANSNGFWDPGYLYDALLENLKPNARYYYSVGTKEHMSEISNFTTPLPAGDTTPYKFVTYGDMGISPYPQAGGTADLILDHLRRGDDIRLTFHHGDISYAEGYAYVWEQYMDLIQPYASLMPYMIGIGNHEQDHTTGGAHDPSGAPGEGGFRPKWGNQGSDSGGECGVPMYKRFHMPDNGNAVWWYSFDYGMVHYVMMSTEHDFTLGSRQHIWLENDLKNVDRTKTPWLILSGHRAMYCSEMYPSDYVYGLNMRRIFEDMLYKYKVDLALWSHYHAYERTCAIYDDECRDDGITHIVVGSGGKSIDKDIWLPKEWSRFHANAYGYGVVTVANSSSLHWEWVQNRYNKVMDHVWIHK